jgi:hypothetical protein
MAGMWQRELSGSGPFATAIARAGAFHRSIDFTGAARLA